MSQPDEQDFDEELFKHTRMSFWDHIEELRAHMWRAIFGFAIAMVGSLFLGFWGVKFIAAPVEKELQHLYDQRRDKILREDQAARENTGEGIAQPSPFIPYGFSRPQLEALLKGKSTEEINRIANPEDDLEKANIVKLWVRLERPIESAAALSKQLQEMGRRPALATMSVMEGFIVYLKVSMYLGLIIGSPWIFYQLWSFIAAGLYPTEKQLVHRYLPFSVFLFISGAAVCQFLVIPNAVRYLLRFNEYLGLEPDLRLNEWLSFAIMFPLVFGISFQTPLLMFGVYKLGIVEIDTFTKNRRIAFFGLSVVSLILVPAPDIFSLFAMMVPLWCLYEVGIVMCKLSPRPIYEDEPDDQETVVGV
jgi:sec-independent protein translocase protein TatC